SLAAQPSDDSKVAPGAASVALKPVPPRDGFSVKTASLFFGSSSIGGGESMERWQPGEEPVIVMPGAVADPDMKVIASLPPVASEPSRAVESGVSIAAKGEVNSNKQHTKTPAAPPGLVDAQAVAK